MDEEYSEVESELDELKEKNKYATIAILPDTKREFLDCREDGEKSADDILRKLVDGHKEKEMNKLPV